MWRRETAELTQALQYHLSHANDLPELKFSKALVLPEVEEERFQSDAFWSVAFALRGNAAQVCPPAGLPGGCLRRGPI